MSQTVTKDVRAKGEVIGQVEITTFDNIDEAIDGLGEDKCVDLINRQNTIAVMDAKRREVTGTGSSGMRDLMKALKENPELAAKIAEELDVAINI